MPVVDVSVERIRFVHPGLPGFRKGDCTRLFGNTAATEVLHTKIIGNTFTDCARLDVAVQRNVNSLTIIGNHFASPRVDQHIDGEASGGEGDKRIPIIGNTSDSPDTTQGDYAVALTSYKYAVISGNIFNGRGMESPQDVTIAQNSIRFPTPTANTIGVMLRAISRPIDGVMISNNRIVDALYAGVRLSASPQPLVAVTLTGNQVRGSNFGLRCEGARRVPAHHFGR